MRWGAAVAWFAAAVALASPYGFYANFILAPRVFDVLFVASVLIAIALSVWATRYAVDRSSTFGRNLRRQKNSRFAIAIIPLLFFVVSYIVFTMSAPAAISLSYSAEGEARFVVEGTRHPYYQRRACDGGKRRRK